MSLKLSRVIPERVETMTALWCRREFMPMSQVYRDARARTRRPMDSCFWCDHKFLDGEMMALAAFHGTGNKVLCQKCAGQMGEDVKEETKC